MFRIYFLTYWGRARSKESEHAHEAPWVMLIPLMVLAFFSTVAGFVPMGDFVSIGEMGHGHAGSTVIPIVAVISGLLGVALAWLFYSKESTRAQWVITKLGKVYTVIQAKFYIDEIYLFVTKRIIFPLIAAPIAWFDRHIVDGAVNLTAYLTRWGGLVLSYIQTGQLQTYGVWLVNGAVVTALIIWLYTR
jgi:NADH-quinone oxidoreductase subunit L